MANQERYGPFRSTAKLTVFDVPVDVEYFYYPGIEATEFEPPVYEEVEVQSVMYEGFDIINLCGMRAIGGD